MGRRKASYPKCPIQKPQQRQGAPSGNQYHSPLESPLQQTHQNFPRGTQGLVSSVVPLSRGTGLLTMDPVSNLTNDATINPSVSNEFTYHALPYLLKPVYEEWAKRHKEARGSPLREATWAKSQSTPRTAKVRARIHNPGSPHRATSTFTPLSLISPHPHEDGSHNIGPI
jgi:hypothetical protein